MPDVVAAAEEVLPFETTATSLETVTFCHVSLSITPPTLAYRNLAVHRMDLTSAQPLSNRRFNVHIGIIELDDAEGVLETRIFLASVNGQLISEIIFLVALSLFCHNLGQTLQARMNHCTVQ